MFFFQAEDGIRDLTVTGVQTCALPISAAAARPDPGARRLLSLEREGQRVLTLLAPGIELVRLEALLPGVLGLVLGAGEPVGAPQLVVRLDQVRPELEGFLEEGLGILVHLALQVDEAEIEVGVERAGARL